MSAPTLEVRGLTLVGGSGRDEVTLVRSLTFSVWPGEVLAIVGESGSGKSMTMLAATGLLPAGVRATAGDVVLNGETIVKDGRFLRPEVRGREIGMIFQDPLTSLNPVRRVGSQLAEALRIGARPQRLTRTHLDERCAEILRSVGLDDTGRILRAFPHELSGGQRQRVMVAIAIANRPSLLIADEPTTALDVTIQKQVLDTIDAIRTDIGSATILVTHDLGIVAQHADRVLVLYGGMLMESATVTDTFLDPIHPYTVGLLGSVLTAELGDGRAPSIPGQIPPPKDRPAGCPFASRCAVSRGRSECTDHEPALTPRSLRTGQSFACHFPEEALAYRDATRVIAELEEDLDALAP
jgi:peptide/nickel transport system ATP-binding protein